MNEVTQQERIKETMRRLELNEDDATKIFEKNLDQDWAKDYIYDRKQ